LKGHWSKKSQDFEMKDKNQGQSGPQAEKFFRKGRKKSLKLP
jgi:hypothetical protein